ncbi:Hsp20/alpha crystallin family protein [Secundilactobacillus kimchicus]|uniref:Molecular chaperone (Small heat shock protein) n=1 Tax=Secundilactobacillus kimchicus JCM 15530 TaxID=1302272 RepID=A0A0R1HUE0_9LACO|nr:Hsp20/alpha crystallin family protein [Secundilactobacillus kimchicus]KRK46922.1 molecular chaperone (small heat shock protein) [Secundilactobacillus kimchicus JCM 15530]MBT9672689.1 Hsp20 family protein [Secundilactobacillus kimchicus]
MARYLANRNFDDLDPMNFFGGLENFGRNFFSDNSMKTDIKESDKDYEVSAELPGFKKDDIHLDYRDDTLRINGVHDLQRQDKDDDGRVLRQERSFSNVSRSFYLPGVDIDQVKATYDGGVLKLTLPKKATTKDDNHQISID